MTNQGYDSKNGPMGEISFLDESLVGDERNAIELKQAKKSSTAQIFNDILEGVERGDEVAVESALGQMREKPGSGWMKRIAKALVHAKPFNSEIADLLYESEVITFYLLYSCVETDSPNDNSAVAWMLSSPEKIVAAKNQIGRTNWRGKQKTLDHVLSRMVRQGDLATLAGLDIGEILRSWSKDEVAFENLFQGTFKHSKSKHFGPLWEKILDPDTVTRVYPGADEKLLKDKGLFICNWMSWGLAHGDRDEIEGMERALRKSPRLAHRWNDYWAAEESPEGMKLNRLNTEVHYRGVHERMGVDPGPANDPLEFMLCAGNRVAMDALTREGPLSDALYKRLSAGNGHLVHIVVSHAKPKEVIPLMTSMMAKLGMEWKDDQGRGWGHSLLLAPEEPNVKHIQSFIRDPRASRLLIQPDNTGKSAMDVLGEHTKFKDNTALHARIRRSLLSKTVSKAGRKAQVAKNSGPKM